MISSVTDLAASGARPTGPQPGIREALGQAFESLGLDPDQMREAHRSGTSLLDAAQAQGVSESDVRDALTTALEAQGVGSDQVSGVAEKVLTQGPPPPPPGGGVGRRERPQLDLDAIADELDVDVEDLLDAISNAASQDEDPDAAAADLVGALIRRYGSLGLQADTNL